MDFVELNYVFPRMHVGLVGRPSHYVGQGDLLPANRPRMLPRILGGDPLSIRVLLAHLLEDRTERTAAHAGDDQAGVGQIVDVVMRNQIVPALPDEDAR